MLQVGYTNQFKRDLKKAKKRRKNLSLIQEVMQLIEYEDTLPAKLKNHSLDGNWNQHDELHLEPDWLLIYKVDSKKENVTFVRTGSHSDLFK